MKTIRALETDAFPEVLKLNAAAQPAVTRLDSIELLRLSALSNAHLVAVDANDVVLGYTLAFYHHANYDGEEFNALQQMIAAPFLYIDQVVISVAERGTGLGRLLYDRLAAVADQRGISWLCCEVNTHPMNAASLAFHNRLDFVQIGTLETRDGRRVALLKKALEHKTELGNALAKRP